MTGEIRRRPGLVVIIGFVATLAGHFTLARVGFTVPVFNDVRLPLFGALLASFALETRWAPRGRHGSAPILLAIYAFLGYQAVSSAWAPPGALVSAALVDLVAIAVLVFVYAQLAEWDRDRVVALTMGCFQVAAWVYFLAAASGLGRGPAGRWAALGGGPNVFVRVMVLGIFSSIYLYATRRRLGWLVGVPAFLFGAVASGSRGGLAALVLTLVLAAPAVLPGMRRAGGKPLLMVIALLVAGVAIAGDSILAFVQQRFINTTFEQGYVSGRDVIFEMALDLWLQHPWRGTGISSFPVIANLGFGVAYIHNLVLAVAAEGGIIGIALLLNTFYRFWRQFARVPRAERSLESRTAAYSGIFVAAACMFSGDYYDARLMWILLTLAAVRPAEPAAPRP